MKQVFEVLTDRNGIEYKRESKGYIHIAENDVPRIVNALNNLSKIKNDINNVYGFGTTYKYVIEDISYNFDANVIVKSIQKTIGDRVDYYNDLIDKVNVDTKYTNKKNNRPIDEGLRNHVKLIDYML